MAVARQGSRQAAGKGKPARGEAIVAVEAAVVRRGEAAVEAKAAVE